MLVYRIGTTKYSNDLSGEGARLYGGRWNHPGIACIYSAETRALSVLEFTAHVSIDTLPKSLSITCIEIPDDSIKSIPLSSLPSTWKSWPHSKSSRDFGTKLLEACKFLVLKFPSAIVPDEFNYVINPLHTRMKEVKIKEVKEFLWDTRLKGTKHPK